MLLTRSPLIHTHHKGRRFTVRLACVKHAASVRPEPGSNSPNKTNKNPNQPHTTSTEPARATVRKSPENQTTWPHPTPTTEARQTKTKQAPKNHTKRAAPQDPWHKKHDTLSSSQTTHSQEKPTNQTGPRASLKAPENLTTKISNLSTRFTVNQTATLETLERKDPSPPNQNQFKEPALCGSGNYLSPTGPRAVNPKTRAPQHIFRRPS